jgi:hypothetical protein
LIYPFYLIISSFIYFDIHFLISLFVYFFIESAFLFCYPFSMKRFFFYLFIFLFLHLIIFQPPPVQAGCNATYDAYGNVTKCTNTGGCSSCIKNLDFCGCVAIPPTSPPAPTDIVASPTNAPNLPCLGPTPACSFTLVCNNSTGIWQCTGTGGSCATWSSWSACYPPPDCIQTRYCVVGNADPQAQACCGGSPACCPVESSPSLVLVLPRTIRECLTTNARMSAPGMK